MPHKLLAALRGLLIRLGLLRPGKLQYIGGSDTLPPPLTREEEGEVLARLDAGEEEARQILIERNLRLVVYIARRFENTGINIEDLISIGTIGLIKAKSSCTSARTPPSGGRSAWTNPSTPTGTATSSCSATCWAPTPTR